MGLSRTLKTLAGQCRRHAPWYRLAVQQHPVLAAYPDPANVLEALASSSPLPVEQRSVLVFALARAQRTRPHPVWQGLLVLAFEPMLRRIYRALGLLCVSDREQRLLLAFLEAVVVIAGHKASGLHAMSLRQHTRRTLFDRLRQEVAEQACNEPFIDAVDPHTEPLATSSLLTAAEVREFADTLDHGALRDSVRNSHPDATDAEVERLYRSAQKSRNRRLQELRATLLRRMERDEARRTTRIAA